MSKISELSDGGSLVSSDYLIAVRSGGNVKVRMDQINVDQVDLGDNEFIRLGNSQDLTMVHTSTQSIINQAGIGDLLIQKAGATKLTINATGIDVTGSVTADGLTVDGSATIQASSSPALIVKDTTNNAEARLQAFNSSATVGTQSNHSFSIETNDTTRSLFATNGDISFYEDTGTTPKFFWDASAEYLSVGSTTGTFAPINYIGSNGRLGINNGNTAGGTKIQSFAATNANGYLAFEGWDKEYMRIDSSGNVGIGVVPESHYTGYVGIDFGKSGGLFANTSGTNITGLSNNAYLNSDASAWVYKETDEASYYNQTAGTHRFSVAPSGTAGTSITWSEAMRIDSSGNLLVGKTVQGIATSGVELTPNDRAAFTKSGGAPILVNRTSDDGEIINLRKDGTTVGSIASTFGADIHVGTGDTRLRFVDDNDYIRPANSDGSSRDGLTDLGASAARFKDLHLSGNVYANALIHDGDSNTYVAFLPDRIYMDRGGNRAFDADSGSTRFGRPDGSEAMRIDASGNLLVGKSTFDDGATKGFTHYSGSGDSATFSTRSSNPPLNLNRLNSDGEILRIRRDGAPVGSIGANGGVPYLSGPLAGGIKLSYYNATNGLIFPVTTTGAIAYGTHDLGYSAATFRDLYLSGGVYLGGTAAANHLDDYEEGTFTPITLGSTTAGTGTYGFQHGSYTKVGNLVTVNIYVDTTSHTGTGSLRVGGLPFTVKGGSDQYAAVSFGELVSVTKTADTIISGYTLPTTTTIGIQQIAIGTTETTTASVPMDGLSRLLLTVTYQT